MNALFDAFGIDWRLLVINLINFGLLSGVLWYYLYGPLTRMLESRRMKIEEGVIAAEAAHTQLQEIQSTRADLLAKAGRESDEVLARARANATEKEREIVAQGETAAQALVLEAQLQAKELQREAIEKSKQEVAKLIVLGIEKTMHESKGAVK